MDGYETVYELTPDEAEMIDEAWMLYLSRVDAVARLHKLHLRTGLNLTPDRRSFVAPVGKDGGA